MLARTLRTTPRSLEEITRLIEMYHPRDRRWCSAPENGGCACAGCVRHPPYSMVGGDPEYRPWPDERDALTEEEVALYRRAKGLEVRYIVQSNNATHYDADIQYIGEWVINLLKTPE